MYTHEFRISKQEQVFCEEYVVDFNATQAAKRAGYSRKSAYSIGSEKLKKPEIENYICYLMAQRSLFRVYGVLQTRCESKVISHCYFLRGERSPLGF